MTYILAEYKWHFTGVCYNTQRNVVKITGTTLNAYWTPILNLLYVTYIPDNSKVP